VLRQQFTEVGGVDAAKSRLELQQQLTEATGEANMYAGQRAVLDEQIRTLGEVRAPCDGIVMSPPRREDIGKLWDMEQNLPICSIGKQEHLQLLVPVVPADYRLLQDDLATEGTLPATIHIPGASQLTWSGVVRRLPESDAKEVPEQLTQKSGGPLAIKPGEKPDSTVPAAQHYLIQTEIVDSDNTILPGTLAQVKIHCRWRTCGWWTWRAISSALDLGLIG
jgi:putative peptide zinc metalloprotease protein